MTAEQETKKETPKQRVIAFLAHEMQACSRKAQEDRDRLALIALENRHRAFIKALPGYEMHEDDAEAGRIARRWVEASEESLAWCEEMVAIYAELLTCVMMRHRKEMT